jgi:hypothetical protein
VRVVSEAGSTPVVQVGQAVGTCKLQTCIRLPAADTLKRYFKALEDEYRVKTAALDTLKRYSILSLTLYLEWYCAYSILYSGGVH